MNRVNIHQLTLCIAQTRVPPLQHARTVSGMMETHVLDLAGNHLKGMHSFVTTCTRHGDVHAGTASCCWSNFFCSHTTARPRFAGQVPEFLDKEAVPAALVHGVRLAVSTARIS